MCIRDSNKSEAGVKGEFLSLRLESEQSVGGPQITTGFKWGSLELITLGCRGVLAERKTKRDVAMPVGP